MTPCLLFLFEMPARRAHGFVGDPLVGRDVFIMWVFRVPTRNTASEKVDSRLMSFFALRSTNGKWNKDSAPITRCAIMIKLRVADYN